MPLQTHTTIAPSSIVLSRLLFHNEVPDALEAASIHQGINDIKGEIFRLQSQLEYLERLLQKHRRVLSAVRRIPAGVWGRIFTFVLPFCLRGNERRELLHLTLVCRAWCQAARLTRRLWNKYSVDTHPFSYKAAKSWLSRSGDLPKSLEVDGLACGHCKKFRRDNGDFRCPIIHPELVKLLLEGPVLNHLSLKCQVPLCFKKLCERLHPSMWISIKSLTIWIEDGWRQVIEGEVMSHSFDIPPNVTSLEISLGYAYDFGCPDRPLCISPIVYARLTSLSFNSGAWSNGAAFLAALKHCTSLESLTINFVCNGWRYDDEDYRIAGRSVSLPCLRTLQLQQACETDILEHLVMPALIELVVRGEYSEGEREFQWYFPNPQVRCPNLRILRLYTPRSVDPSELAAILKYLPHLTEVTLSGAVPDIHARRDYYGHEPKNVEEVGEHRETPMRDVFQMLHSWDQKYGANRNLSSLQVLEILDLPENYNFSYISNYIAARSRKPPGEASDTLKQLTITFLPTRFLKNCNFGDFKNVQEVLERRGIRASITPSELKPFRQDWNEPLYPFRAQIPGPPLVNVTY
ncbi:hypothetical protein EST38_g4504 [Candolleomyces aberdarensis]|uniref:Uncharacterized protein n=1 Tax=Candolleomyces aberdarensis TaxID=2316362 RepID=A0A4V1Q4A0_9AGAR|nr:hypothetical protein EST38_g4504 [Candolleomyces aberdarensis]